MRKQKTFQSFSVGLNGLTLTNTFVLVHGACHGAWPWYKVVALMRSSGHNVTAIDLGASGINPEQVLEVPRHSFGGFASSKAMESFPEKISVARCFNAWSNSQRDHTLHS
uniref:AB hydrolase-1 domain-containing protein n=1 Tax=Solanum lycopersicum TaxID=4081 RepID=A0A3Q7EUB0_SOLLC